MKSSEEVIQSLLKPLFEKLGKQKGFKFKITFDLIQDVIIIEEDDGLPTMIGIYLKGGDSLEVKIKDGEILEMDVYNFSNISLTEPGKSEPSFHIIFE